MRHVRDALSLPFKGLAIVALGIMLLAERAVDFIEGDLP